MNFWIWRENNSNIMNTLLMSDEAHYHVFGYVNKQNYRSCTPNIPHERHQHPLQNAKVTVWCAVSSHCITGPYYFGNALRHTVNVNAEQ
jgi:hypothetical protein